MMERAQENEAFESEKGIVAVAKEIATLEKEIADQEKSIKDPVWRVGSQEEKVQKEINHLEKEAFTQKERMLEAYQRDIALINKREQDTIEIARMRRDKEYEQRTSAYNLAIKNKDGEFDNYITKKKDQLELLDSKKEKILENTKSPVSLNKKKRLLQEKIKSYDGKVGAYKMIYPKKYHREICDNYRDCRGYRWNCDSQKGSENIFEEKEKTSYPPPDLQGGSENFKIFEKQSPTLFETAPPKIDQLPPSDEESFSSRYIREQKEIEAREKRTLNYQPDSLEREFQKQEAELLIARKNAEEEWKKWEAEHS